MDDDIYGARIYTDIQGLKRIQYDKNSVAAKKEVAQQFESLMMQMVLRSMRDATKAMSSGLLSNNQMELYQDMFDKQISLMMSNSNIGLASMIEKSIDQLSAPHTASNNQPVPVVSTATQTSAPLHSNENLARIEEMAVKPDNQKAAAIPFEEMPKGEFASPEDFVKKLWKVASKAAGFIGTAPEILIAQAALETNWGRSVLPNGKNGSTNNLFNIKATAEDNHSATVDTLEQKNGVLVKEKAKFKSYSNYYESFMDYVGLVKNNDRYHEAVAKAAKPEQYIQALHRAGYATDQDYSEKVLKIFSSPIFQTLVNKAKTP